MFDRGVVSRILFPAPRTSYSADSFPGELVWVPKVGTASADPSTVEERVPCLLLTYPSARFIIIFFHSNAEDLGRCRGFCAYLREQFQVHVLAVEYPGYGICPGTPTGETVMENAFAALYFARSTLQWPLDSIKIFGRSIGTGPAIGLASLFRFAGVILVTPFLSVQKLFRDRVGPLSGLVNEVFNNEEAVRKISSPTMIIHGQKDTMIQFHHGESLYSLLRSRKIFVSPPDMEHNTNLLANLQFFVLPMFQFFALPDYVFQDLVVPAWAYDQSGNGTSETRMPYQVSSRLSPVMAKGDLSVPSTADDPDLHEGGESPSAPSRSKPRGASGGGGDAGDIAAGPAAPAAATRARSLGDDDDDDGGISLEETVPANVVEKALPKVHALGSTERGGPGGPRRRGASGSPAAKFDGEAMTRLPPRVLRPPGEEGDEKAEAEEAVRRLEAFAATLRPEQLDQKEFAPARGSGSPGSGSSSGSAFLSNLASNSKLKMIRPSMPTLSMKPRQPATEACSEPAMSSAPATPSLGVRVVPAGPGSALLASDRNCQLDEPAYDPGGSPPHPPRPRISEPPRSAAILPSFRVLGRLPAEGSPPCSADEPYSWCADTPRVASSPEEPSTGPAPRQSSLTASPSAWCRGQPARQGASGAPALLTACCRSGSPLVPETMLDDAQSYPRLASMEEELLTQVGNHVVALSLSQQANRKISI